MNVRERRTLRRELHARRAVVPLARRRVAAKRAALHARRCGLLNGGKLVAVYVALRSEFDTAPLLEAAHAAGCEVYLPAIRHLRRRRMEFRRQSARRSRLTTGLYGLREPPPGCRTVAARRLDVVFVPLVAVDPTGTRLGMGGGFYDRHFAHRRELRGWRRPRLIGLGYDFQRVLAIERARWDVPLDGVITEAGFYRTRNERGAQWRDPQ